MTTAVAEAVVQGHAYPRIATPPLVVGPPGPCGCGCGLTSETSYGFEVDDFARTVLGVTLDKWQRYIVIHAGERLADGRPRFLQVLILVARQNGKTTLLKVLTLYWLYMDRVNAILGTSTNLKYARKAWEQAVEMAEKNPWLARGIASEGIRHANGQEELRTVWGGVYEIAASNRKGGRSTTLDRLVMDELREHKDWDAYNAAKPATHAVRDAQIFMLSNMGDDRSEVLNSLRDQALAGMDVRLGIFEWSSPDPMEADDIEAIAMANPTLGGRIDIDSIIGDAKRAKAAGGEQLAQFLTEVHCRRVSLLNPAIDMDKWAGCRGDADLGAFKSTLAFCLDVSPEGLHASLYAAAVDGLKVRVDAVQAWEGQTAVREMSNELPGLVARVKPRVLGWFPGGPAAAAAADLEKRRGWPPSGVRLEPIRNVVTAVCMGFAEQVHSLSIVHGGDRLLDAHVSAAEKLYVGDGWRFTRRGAGQVDAAYAAAGAVHLARTLPVAPAPRATVLSI